VQPVLYDGTCQRIDNGGGRGGFHRAMIAQKTKSVYTTVDKITNWSAPWD